MAKIELVVFSSDHSFEAAEQSEARVLQIGKFVLIKEVNQLHHDSRVEHFEFVCGVYENVGETIEADDAVELSADIVVGQPFDQRRDFLVEIVMLHQPE